MIISKSLLKKIVFFIVFVHQRCIIYIVRRKRNLSDGMSSRPYPIRLCLSGDRLPSDNVRIGAHLVVTAAAHGAQYSAGQHIQFSLLFFIHYPSEKTSPAGGFFHFSCENSEKQPFLDILCIKSDKNRLSFIFTVTVDFFLVTWYDKVI